MIDQVFEFARLDLSKPNDNKFVVIGSGLSEDLASFVQDFQEALPSLMEARSIVDYESAEGLYDAFTEFCEDNELSIEYEDDEGETQVEFPAFITQVVRVDFGNDYRILINLVGSDDDYGDEDEDSDVEEDWEN